MSTSQPSGVMSSWCSNCAERLPSSVTAVQPSGHVLSRWLPLVDHGLCSTGGQTGSCSGAGATRARLGGRELAWLASQSCNACGGLPACGLTYCKHLPCLHRALGLVLQAGGDGGVGAGGGGRTCVVCVAWRQERQTRRAQPLSASRAPWHSAARWARSGTGPRCRGRSRCAPQTGWAAAGGGGGGGGGASGRRGAATCSSTHGWDRCTPCPGPRQLPPVCARVLADNLANLTVRRARPADGDGLVQALRGGAGRRAVLGHAWGGARLLHGGGCGAHVVRDLDQLPARLIRLPHHKRLVEIA